MNKLIIKTLTPAQIAVVSNNNAKKINKKTLAPGQVPAVKTPAKKHIFDITYVLYEFANSVINDHICLYYFAIFFDGEEQFQTRISIAKDQTEDSLNESIVYAIEEEIENRCDPDTYVIHHKRYREPIFYDLIRMSNLQTGTHEEYLSY